MAKEEITVCDGCGKELHTMKPGYMGVSLDAHEGVSVRGMDLCGNCYAVINSLEKKGFIVYVNKKE